MPDTNKTIKEDERANNAMMDISCFFILWKKDKEKTLLWTKTLYLASIFALQNGSRAFQKLCTNLLSRQLFSENFVCHICDSYSRCSFILPKDISVSNDVATESSRIKCDWPKIKENVSHGETWFFVNSSKTHFLFFFSFHLQVYFSFFFP